ncbi:magnesium transporter NIPA-domain-containing protein [Melanogaster broomeanus]|nr:magnesium transporter NIPA-domain-containing protein [Melanogaster broomeanus]
MNGTTTIHEKGIDLPHLTLHTVIGITVAIAGNVLISLALNLQKLAHSRLDRERDKLRQERESRTLERNTNSRRVAHLATAANTGGSQLATQESLQLETQPLIPHRSSSLPPTNSYGLAHSGTPAASEDTRSQKSSYTTRSRQRQYKQGLASRFLPLGLSLGSNTSDSSRTNGHRPGITTIPVDDVSSGRDGRAGKYPPEEWDEDGNESDYLRSKLWWSGFILMNVGEIGNFISYAFAPASVVAPLGTFALVANCFFAPLMLKERFRPRDLFGILLAVIGATTVVLSTPSSDGAQPVLTPEALIEAITQRSFIIFSIVYMVCAVILGGLSEGSVGKRIVVIDVGLCAIFGGFTVLSTKAISTLLTKEWAKMFTEWITYPILTVLVITGVLQIRFLNRALKRFDSKIVIPTQFVFFTLSAVIGSAVLYGDFRRATFHEMVTFLYGCAATFAGVFVIAWSPSGNAGEIGHDDETRSEEAGRREEASRIDGNVAVGSLRTRSRPALVIPKGPRETPILRKKQSTSLVGYSPVQHLLLARTPPRDRSEYLDRETESGSIAGSTRGGNRGHVH